MIREIALLLSAHVFADFLLQPASLAERKKRPLFLLLHAALHAGTAYVVLQQGTLWIVPVYVFLTHAVIDGVKVRVPDDARSFLIDQGAHVAALLFLLPLGNALGRPIGFDGSGWRAIIAAAGFLATVRGAGFFIGKVVSPIVERNRLDLGGLKDGGRMIGQLERALIFLFLLIGEPAGIGFLFAAKSILRFEEAKRRPLAEYVLIGTLLSFVSAVALGSLTLWALRNG